MTNSPAVNVDKIQELLASGNLAQFTAQERVAYINKVCEMTGLNPLTRPFEFLTFQGKMVMYASKGCADQLRKIHKVSIIDAVQKIENDILFSTVKGQDASGRIDTEVSALSIKGLSGEALANATMKGLTKAKRRLTLSMVGLGILDEMEVETVQGAHVDTNARLIPPPSEKDFEFVRARLAIAGRTEAALINSLRPQFPDVPEKVEEFNSAMIEYAKRKIEDLITKEASA